MMGFGQAEMMPLSWIGGLVAVAVVWGGVWMLLAAIGVAPSSRGEGSDEPTPHALMPDTTWQQPDFTDGSVGAERQGAELRDGDRPR